MENLIGEIKAIKSSANWYYQACNIWDDKDYSKRYEYWYLINDYIKAVKWMRMCGVEIDEKVV